MNKEVRDAIQQADSFIKEEDFKSAWQVLLPYQNDPMARKRLVWLKQKRQQAATAGKERNMKSNVQKRYGQYLFISLLIVFGLGILAIYGLSSRETVLPTAVGEEPSIASDSTVTVLARPSATEVPPTEAAQEVGLQQQLRDWFVGVEGVSQVLTLDVDVPIGDPPLIYAEIVVSPGFNDTRIPDMFVQKLNETLNTTDYSDFVIIVNDELRVVEYRFDSESILWHQTELTSAVPPTAEPV
jgi:hypothetical protein